MKKIYIFKNKGFTLVELMIVVSIIGVLAGIVLNGMREIRNRAHDIQVRSDVNSIHRALYNYASEHSEKYPKSNVDGQTVEQLLYYPDNFDKSSYTAKQLVGGGYISAIPMNKKKGGPYYYWSDGNMYTLEGGLLAGGKKVYQAYREEDGKDYNFRVSDKSLDRPPYWLSKLLTIINVNRDTGAVTFRWSAAHDMNPPVNYYLEYRLTKLPKGPENSWTRIEEKIINTTEYTISEGILDMQKTYDFRVVAVDTYDNEDEDENERPSLLNVDFTDETPPEILVVQSITNGFYVYSNIDFSPMEYWTNSEYAAKRGQDTCLYDKQNTENGTSPMGNNKVKICLSNNQKTEGIAANIIEYIVDGDNWENKKELFIESDNYAPIALRGFVSLPAGKYHLRAKRLDKAGNIKYWSDASNPIVRTIEVGGVGEDQDYIAPTFGLNPITTVSHKDGKLTVIWKAASDNIGVVRYSYKVNNSNSSYGIEQLFEGETTNTAIILDGYLDGASSVNSVLVKITAYDAAGNSATYNSKYYYIS